MNDRRLERLFLSYRDRGDVDALTGVFDATAPGLFALASHLIRDLDRAEDAVQETFLAAIEAAARYEGGRSLYPWLAGILTRTARKQNRQDARRVEPTRLDEPRAEDPAQESSRRELDARLERALERLTPRTREVLAPFLLEERKPRDIARGTGLAPGTVRVRIHRGLEELRRMLPPGLALSGLVAFESRGLAAVRAEVVRHAAARAAAVSIPVAAVPLVSGGLAMSLKLTTLVLVSALGLLAWRARDTSPKAALVPEAPRPAGGAPLEAALARVVEDPRREPGDSSTVPDPQQQPTEPLAQVAPGSPGVFLRGTLSGSLDGFALSLTDLSEGLGTARFETPATGSSYEIDISSYAPLDGELPALLWIDIDDASLEQTQFLAQLEPHEPAAKRREYRADLSLRRAAARIVGQVVFEGNRTLAKVAFQPDRGLTVMVAHGVYEEETPTLEKIVRCDAEGRFVLPLERTRPGTLAVYVEHLRPRTLRIEFGDATELDVGRVELEPGASLAGRAWWRGQPVPEDTLVYLRPEDGLEHQNLDTLHHGARGFVHAFRSATTDREGRFTFTGLEADAPYRVRVVPTVDGAYYHHQEIPGLGTLVTAPASDAVVECELTALSICVRSEGEPVPTCTLVRKRLDGSPLAASFGGMAFHTPESPDEHGDLRLLAHPTEHFLAEIRAIGFDTFEQLLDPGNFVDGFLELELRPARMEPVRLALLHSDPARLEGLPMRVSLYGPGHPHGEYASATVHAGALTLDLPPEHDHQVDLVPCFAPERPPRDQLLLLPMRTWVRGPRDRTFRVNARLGALIELDTTLLGTAAEYRLELVGPDGEHLHVTEYFHASEGGSRRDAQLAEHGRCVAGELLKPGRWELRVLRGGSQTSLFLDLEPGEVELVALTP